MKRSKRTLLIIPSSLSLTPYVYNYLEVFKDQNIDKVDLLIWDRLSNYSEVQLSGFESIIEEIVVYNDKKKNIRKGMRDYFRFAQFGKRNIKFKDYYKVIIFSPQVFLFFKHSLSKRNLVTILDIRDYHPTIRVIEKLGMYKKVDVIVVSSPAFKNFIQHNNIVINHNTRFNYKDIIKENRINLFPFSQKIFIGSIGAFRDWEVNLKLVEKFKNKSNYTLKYMGEGLFTQDLEMYVKTNRITNVEISGFFEYEQIPTLYGKINLCNVLRDNDKVINKYALPNRLYDAVQYCCPLVSNEGNFMSNLILEYNLGVVIGPNEDIEVSIEEYLNNFSNDEFLEGRKNFMNAVLKDNEAFKKKISQLE